MSSKNTKGEAQGVDKVSQGDWRQKERELRRAAYRMAPKTEVWGQGRREVGEEVKAGCVVHSFRTFGHKGKEKLI